MKIKSKKVSALTSKFKKLKRLSNIIVFRSKLEYKFALIFDNSPMIQEWQYECTMIPYVFSIDKKVHSYIMDFTIKMTDGTTMLVEVKPKSKLYKETQYDQDDKLDYIKNQDKWSAAKKYCEQRKFKFRIMTEKDL